MEKNLGIMKPRFGERIWPVRNRGSTVVIQEDFLNTIF